MTIIKTRFAPSPTGYLHIGGARTALFNYLFAKKHGGEFALRIEDTDIARSTEDAKKAILTSLKWLDIMPDSEIIYQSQRRDRHIEVANQLLSSGNAYYCFTKQEEISKMREDAISSGKHFIFNSPWRNASPDQYPKEEKPVIRLKSPKNGQTIINDLVQGDVVFQNDHLDDMILLRSDGTPTYMLAVVVDDHDMKITHIIRGDDHLNNAARQQIIYEALGWDTPKMSHIPLIYGPDGAKLSKRHGALGVEAYEKMGYLPDAINNYLLRLGWSHGDEEIISREESTKLFGIDGLGKSPSRIDFDKMKHVNAIYLRNMSNEELYSLILNKITAKISDESKNNIQRAIPSIKTRSELITDLCDLAMIYIVDQELKYEDKAIDSIKNADKDLVKKTIITIENLPDIDFNKDVIQNSLKELAKNNKLKLGELMQHIRPLISGRINAPSVFEMIEILGKKAVLKRLMV